jgi:hypothetical protein
MNDAQPPPHGPEKVMQSAGYFRDQAALCLEIARHISDPQAVENLRTSAARHLIRADDVEKRSGGAPIHQSRSGGTIKRLSVAGEKQGSSRRTGDENQGEAG